MIHLLWLLIPLIGFIFIPPPLDDDDCPQEWFAVLDGVEIPDIELIPMKKYKDLHQWAKKFRICSDSFRIYVRDGHMYYFGIKYKDELVGIGKISRPVKPTAPWSYEGDLQLVWICGVSNAALDRETIVNPIRKALGLKAHPKGHELPFQL